MNRYQDCLSVDSEPEETGVVGTGRDVGAWRQGCRLPRKLLSLARRRGEATAGGAGGGALSTLGGPLGDSFLQASLLVKRLHLLLFTLQA